MIRCVVPRTGFTPSELGNRRYPGRRAASWTRKTRTNSSLTARNCRCCVGENLAYSRRKRDVFAKVGIALHSPSFGMIPSRHGSHRNRITSKAERISQTMSETAPEDGRLKLEQARDLTQCFGHHRAQPLEYALNYCLQCRKLKSCVRASWRVDLPRPWRRDDWWPDETPKPPRRSATRPRAKRTPVNIS